MLGELHRSSIETDRNSEPSSLSKTCTLGSLEAFEIGECLIIWKAFDTMIEGKEEWRYEGFLWKATGTSTPIQSFNKNKNC